MDFPSLFLYSFKLNIWNRKIASVSKWEGESRELSVSVFFSSSSFQSCTDEDPEKAGSFIFFVFFTVASLRSPPSQPVTGGGATQRCYTQHHFGTLTTCWRNSSTNELGSLSAVWSNTPTDREITKQRLWWCLRYRGKWGTQTAQQATPFGNLKTV